MHAKMEARRRLTHRASLPHKLLSDISRHLFAFDHGLYIRFDYLLHVTLYFRTAFGVEMKDRHHIVPGILELLRCVYEGIVWHARTAA